MRRDRRVSLARGMFGVLLILSSKNKGMPRLDPCYNAYNTYVVGETP